MRRLCVALLLVTLTLGGCASSVQRRVFSVGPASPLVAAVSSRMRTEQLLTRLLSRVHLPGEAQPRSTAPARALDEPFSTAVSPDFLDRHEWWVVPGSVSHTFARVKSSGVRGCPFDGSGSSSGDGPSIRQIECSARPTSYAAQPDVQLEAVPAGGDTDIRVDAMAIWIPRRPSFSRVVHPTSVHAVVVRHGHPVTVRRTLDASAARRLAAVLNAQGVDPPATTSCPADFLGYYDTVAFRTPNGPVTATVELLGCPIIEVRVAHRRTVLVGAGTVDAAVRTLLHLPRSYDY